MSKARILIIGEPTGSGASFRARIAAGLRLLGHGAVVVTLHDAMNDETIAERPAAPPTDADAVAAILRGTTQAPAVGRRDYAGGYLEAMHREPKRKAQWKAERNTWKGMKR